MLKIASRSRGAEAEGAGRSGTHAAARERPRVLLVVNVDWFFLSHRLPLARAARDAGAEVIVAAGDTGASDRIRAEGLGFVPLPISRHGTNALGEARSFAALFRLYGRLRPDLVHHVTIKPVLYGSLCARLLGVPAVVNAISGLGSFLTSDHRRRGLRAAVDVMYRAALHNPSSRTIFQNPDDRALFVDAGLIPARQAVLIRGAGVDTALFRPTPEPPGAPVVMLPSRMLWDKGVVTFVEAARALRAGGAGARFVLAGPTDEGNFMAVPRGQLEAWVAEGVVEWWGPQDRMEEILPQASVVVLPSRREGVPKVLLEAGACARPLVASDVPGCREVVRDGETGIRVPFEDSTKLAKALAALLDSPETRRRYGAAARRMVETEFSEEIVVEQTMDLYRSLLPAGALPARRPR